MTSSGSAVSEKAVKRRRSQNTATISRPEHGDDLAAVALEHLLVAAGDDEIGQMRREEALQLTDALQLDELRGDPFLESPVPLRQLAGLDLKAPGLVLGLVVQGLDPEHGLDPGDQRGLVDRLGQVLLGAGLEALDHVDRVRLGGDQDDRHERQPGLALEPPADLDAVHLGHHNVEQDEIRMVFAGGRQGGLAVGRGQDVVALAGQAGAEDVQVRRVVVGDEDLGR
jgi:hypothetical protein